MQIARLPSSSDPQLVLDHLKRDGGVVLEGVIIAEEVAAINAEMDVELGPLPAGNWAVDSETWIAEFQGYLTKRLQHCVKHSPTYRNRFVANPQIAEIVAKVLGSRAGTQSLFASQAIEIWPGEKAQELHRDATPFHARLDLMSPQSPELVFNSLLALTDVTEEMGATRIIPGSHLWPDQENVGNLSDTIPATLRAGDALLLTGRLVHGGGANVTKDRPRRVISTAWTLGFLKSEEAWHFAIPLDEARTYPEIVQRYLGFYSPAYRDEEPGFLWRVDSLPLQKYLKLTPAAD
jgi:ectoine hydroxylase-related dioxygenase (phytanoyl-CoA dioxygenase family)